MHAAKLIDWGLARIRRSRAQAAAQPASAQRVDGDAVQSDDVSSPIQIFDEPIVPDGIAADEWEHSKKIWVRSQHAPELLAQDFSQGQQYTPQSDVWDFGAIVLLEMLFCCCCSLMQALPDPLSDGRNSAGYRSYAWSKWLQLSNQAVSQRFREEFQKNQPPPSPDETKLFNELCNAWERMCGSCLP